MTLERSFVVFLLGLTVIFIPRIEVVGEYLHVYIYCNDSAITAVRTGSSIAIHCDHACKS